MNLHTLKQQITEALEKGHSVTTIKDMVDVAYNEVMKSIEQEPDVIKGRHGNCVWEIRNNVLTVYPIEGTDGYLCDQKELSYSSPWEKYSDDVFEVFVQPGVHADTYADYLFAGLNFCTTMDVSNLNTTNTKYMGNMFAGCSKMTSLKLDGAFDTSHVKTMDYMFHICSSLKELDVRSFNTSHVVNMCAMFEGCTALEKLLLHFDTRNVNDMGNIFTNCMKLEATYKFDTRNVIRKNDMCWHSHVTIEER